MNTTILKNTLRGLAAIAIYSLSLSASAQTYAGSLAPLHVEGRELKDDKGSTILLHGVMDTPNPYFNSYRWGWQCTASNITPCVTYFNRLFTAITDSTSGAYCNVFRLHLDPCWTNDPSKPQTGTETGEANISQYSGSRLTSYMKTLYWKIAANALKHGLYVIMRPPGVCPRTIQVGGEYQDYLLDVWDRVTKNDSVLKYSGQVSIELANEPITVLDANGADTGAALHDFFQPIVDKIRANGFEGIIWVPGSGYQSNYRGYAAHPIEGENIGYAVHDYPGWFETSDKSYDHANAIRAFGDAVPVVHTNPIMVTEIDWSPEQPGAGKYNEFGEWVPANYGTWGTASTSKWGLAFKAIHDHYGNIGMTLTGTADYIDIDQYINNKQVVPAFKGVTEACGEACFAWYKEFAEQNRMNAEQTLTDDDLTMQSLTTDATTLTVLTGGYRMLSIVCTALSGKTEDVAPKCHYTTTNAAVATVLNGRIITHTDGEADITATYTDGKGNSQSLTVHVTATTFPLTAADFNPSIWETGKFVEATGSLTTGQYGFGGWQYPSGIDLSAYNYLVVNLKASASCAPSFRIFDHNNYWTDPYMADMGTSKSAVIDLRNMKNSKGEKVDPSHIYIAGFWTLGGSPIYISEVFLSMDGKTPVETAIAPLPSLADEPIGTEIFTLDGRQVQSLTKGVNIVRTVYRDGRVETKKVLKK